MLKQKNDANKKKYELEQLIVLIRTSCARIYPTSN